MGWIYCFQNLRNWSCAAAFNFSGSCKSSLPYRFVLQMYLIKYIKKIPRKPEVAETERAPNHLSFSFYPKNSHKLGQLSLWIKLIAQLPRFKWAAVGSEYYSIMSHFQVSCRDPLPTRGSNDIAAAISAFAHNRQMVTGRLWQLHNFFEPPLSQYMKIVRIFSSQTKY